MADNRPIGLTSNTALHPFNAKTTIHSTGPTKIYSTVLTLNRCTTSRHHLSTMTAPIRCCHGLQFRARRRRNRMQAPVNKGVHSWRRQDLLNANHTCTHRLPDNSHLRYLHTTPDDYYLNPVLSCTFFCTQKTFPVQI
jgi:hypothetical protein